MARRAAARRAMTLFELIAVMFIIGIVSLMAVTRYSTTTHRRYRRPRLCPPRGPRLLASPAAGHRDRRQPPASLHALRRQCHAIRASTARSSGVPTLVDDVHAVPANVTVTTGGVTDVEFQFTGEALASYTVTITAPDRTPHRHRARKSPARPSCSSSATLLARPVRVTRVSGSPHREAWRMPSASRLISGNRSSAQPLQPAFSASPVFCLSTGKSYLFMGHCAYAARVAASAHRSRLVWTNMMPFIPQFAAADVASRKLRACAARTRCSEVVLASAICADGARAGAGGAARRHRAGRHHRYPSSARSPTASARWKSNWRSSARPGRREPSPATLPPTASRASASASRAPTPRSAAESSTN